MISLVAGWGAWSFKQQSATNVSLPALQEPTAQSLTTSPTTDTPTTETPTAQMPTTQATAAPDVEMVPNATSHLIGKPLPAWSFPVSAWMNTATPVTLAQLKGNVTLVEIFRINCSHCNQSVPFMNAIQGNYTAQGLKMVGIQSPLERNPDENDWAKVQQVVKNFWRFTYPVAFDNKAQYLQKIYHNDREQMRWPTVLLLDRKGIVVYGYTGHRPNLEVALYEKIRQELAK